MLYLKGFVGTVDNVSKDLWKGKIVSINGLPPGESIEYSAPTKMGVLLKFETVVSKHRKLTLSVK